MELSVTYVASQVFTIIMYALLAITYYVKNRKAILILNLISLIANGLAYVLLNAYSGLAMCIIALVRNIVFLVDEKRNGKTDEIYKKDVIILILVYIACIISAVVTFEGFLSLLSIFATIYFELEFSSSLLNVLIFQKSSKSEKSISSISFKSDTVILEILILSIFLFHPFSLRLS